MVEVLCGHDGIGFRPRLAELIAHEFECAERLAVRTRHSRKGVSDILGDILRIDHHISARREVEKPVLGNDVDGDAALEIERDGLPLLGFVNGDICNGRCRDLARDMVEDQHLIPDTQLLDGDHAAVRETDERIGSEATIWIAVHSQRDIRLRHGEAILRLAIFLYGRRAALIAEMLVIAAGVCDLGGDLLARDLADRRLDE